MIGSVYLYDSQCCAQVMRVTWLQSQMFGGGCSGKNTLSLITFLTGYCCCLLSIVVLIVVAPVANFALLKKITASLPRIIQCRHVVRPRAITEEFFARTLLLAPILPSCIMNDNIVLQKEKYDFSVDFFTVFRYRNVNSMEFGRNRNRCFSRSLTLVFSFFHFFKWRGRGDSTFGGVS